MILLFAIIAALLTTFAGLRLVISYLSLVTALKELKDEEKKALPPEICRALNSRWVSSWQSVVFHEVTVGDTSWAQGLSVRGEVDRVRRDWRFGAIVCAAGIGVLVLQLVIGGGK